MEVVKVRIAMATRKRFFTNILDERIAYRLVLSFALMSIIPMLLTTYLIATIWLPSLNLWGQVGLFLLLGLLVSVMGFFLSRTIVYTILKTSERAKEIADGDLSKRLEIENERSEIALLAKAFNQITAQLEQKIKDLEASEEKFRKLVDNVPDLLYYLDAEGNITSVNEEVSQLLGYTKEELLGSPFCMIVRQEDYEKYERVLRERRADESRLVKGLRVALKTAQGIYRTFEINSRGVYDPDDKYVGTEGLARDISAQLALESEREEFLYMLTHDIKNPMSAIMFIVYMMRDGTIPPPKYPEYYEKIERACNNVTRLVEDFLECKKFERGTVNLDMRKVDLHKMLDNIAYTYRSEAQAKGKSLTANLERDHERQGLLIEIDERYFPRVV